ncbi:MAG TPA: hypothetical protein VE685_04140 [Thermoanaerobaculia bacterium]|nr:hypothetical protein [Thermoanaerobaculia bacterium]
MATVTIRDVPDDVIQRLKSDAERRGRSLEEELRSLIESQYRTREEKKEALARIRERWKDLPETTPEEVKAWIKQGRP